ncbi:MotA/TolQ/ExbB proton channel family protein [Ruminococcaceae bacterium OttesenSCG-928-L11]|nr:MotA/TolQ/ExbB proton channel family protein [Ruminococcaceae bacterium OttesenSCG-928-L11]
MNLSFVIGLVLAFVLVLFGIVFDTETSSLLFENLGNFEDPTSLLITVGGTIATIVASHPFSLLSKIPAHFGVIMRKQQDPLHYINIMTDLSQEARKKGLLALEDSVSEFDDQFLKSSVMLIVDAMEPDKVREQLESELSNIEGRHAQAAGMYDKGAAIAPGFGMIGTLIGLINMLAQMNFEDEGGASKLAKNMAVALITTFYGSLLANAMFIPMANQLRLAHEQEMLCKEIIIEGIISIQAGENPRHIHEKLLSYLTQKQREKAGDGESGE